jgi:dienelactone hydrolase
MKMIEVPYGQNFKGSLFLPEGTEPHPCIILFHAWMGKDAIVTKKAEELVETLGVAAFTADLYGEGQVVKTPQEATALMGPLFMDRLELKRRAHLALDAASAQAAVKKNRIGAIGFCFGGLAAIELYRSGAPVVGVAAFHPVLGDQREGHQANTFPISKEIKGSILILHGYLDPLNTAQDVDQFQKEMSQAGVDWQFNTYGRAKHAFTNPDAHDEKSGLVFNQEINNRAFAAASHFFMNLL